MKDGMSLIERICWGLAITAILDGEWRKHMKGQ